MGYRLLQVVGQPGAVEDVVPQNHGAAVLPDKFLAQNKRLSQPVRGGLYLIGQVDAKLTAVSQQPLKVGQILRGRNNQNIPDSRQHQGGQRIKNHWLIIHRQKLLGSH